MTPTRWIYIAGDIRSGSTLLADLLTQSLEAFNAGELGRLWECLELGQLCTCGDPIDECVIWGEVTQRAQKEAGVDSYHVASELAFGQMTHPTILRSRKLAPPSRDELALRTATERAVEAVTGADVVLDATKMARTLWVASHLDRPLTAVHLTRDPRAVAFACMSKSARDPSLDNSYLGKQSVPRATLSWAVRNMACRRVLRAQQPTDFHQVRYEDVATQPETAIGRIAGQSAEILDAFGSVASGECHSIGGNPRRFTATDIQLDERWRTGMAPQWKGLATLLSAPWLRTYGYNFIPK